MKKTSVQEISELIKAKDGNELERAAAIAVVSALLANRQAQQKVANSSWASKSGLREGLDSTWKGTLRC
jgi:hypothetical protein